MRKLTDIYTCFCLFSGSLLLGSCKKLLEINPPIDTVTTEEMFANNRQAELAIAGVYSTMVHGTQINTIRLIPDNVFSSGLSTIAGGLSSDELLPPASAAAEELRQLQNKITLVGSPKSDAIWKSAYKIIYDATAVIDGIEGSTSDALIAGVRNQLTGEALSLRAFSYFYLVNYFGDVPLVLTSDSKKLLDLKRSPVSKVYDQIIADLVKARSLLSTDFVFTSNEKVRVNKWFAEALLARIYLYTGRYQDAINSATAVIGQTGLFGLEQDLSNVFLKNSREAIFQLKQTSDDPYLKNGTPEGLRLLYVPGSQPSPLFMLSEQLLNSFEVNDKRKTVWTAAHPPHQTPAKYRNGEGREYYMVMRLAEQYLIRAEATVRSAPGNVNAAIADINQLRRRADLTELDNDLPATVVLDTIMHERRIELFAEWGHRWFDLKRTGKAHDVLSAIPVKQPWWGDFQLLYPIPVQEIRNNSLLEQNPEYDNL